LPGVAATLFDVLDAGNGSSPRGGITTALPADAFIANFPYTAQRNKPPNEKISAALALLCFVDWWRTRK